MIILLSKNTTGKMVSLYEYPGDEELHAVPDLTIPCTWFFVQTF